MVNSPNVDLVSWSNGDSFVIVDVEKFSRTVLPKYFKHSKFSSFVRQLNFYGFRKIRSENHQASNGDTACQDYEDDDSSADGSTKKMTTVRFYHEFFKANHPELLFRIQRATKSAEPPSPTQIENLREQVESMKEQMDLMSEQFEAKLIKIQTTMDADYQRRFAALDASYKQLLAMIVKERYSIGHVASTSTSGVSRNSVLAMAAAQEAFAAEQQLLSTLNMRNIMNNGSARGMLEFVQRNSGGAASGAAAAAAAMDLGYMGKFR